MKQCECGCGQIAPLATQNCTRRGYVKGEPMRFVNGHQNRGRLWGEAHREKFIAAMTGKQASDEKRAKISATHKARGIQPSREATAKGNANRPTMDDSPSWKGGVSIVNGRRCIYAPDHHRAHKNGYVYEHILVAEASIGRDLFPAEVVHHIDRDKTNNSPENLMVLSSQSEHAKLHKMEDGKS